MTINVEAILHAELTEAMKQRSTQPYSNEDGFSMSVKAVNPVTGNLFTLPIQWHSEEEKRREMCKAAVVAHFAKIPALLVTSDVRWLRSEPFAKHFGITWDGFDDWQAKYKVIMERHNYEMKNLPRELWSEAVMVAIKGPGFPSTELLSYYEPGLNDRVQWRATYAVPEGGSKNYLIPDYWSDEYIAQLQIPAKNLPVLKAIAAAFSKSDNASSV